MSSSRIYLDSNATTRPLPAVCEAVAAVHDATWGNASSLHARGRDAARALSAARADVGAWLGASVTEVVFTSGGTEGDRLGVLGALAAAGDRRHIVCSSLEHPAIRALLRDAPNQPWGAGVEVSWVRPEPDGALRAAAIKAALRPDTALVALHWANNETGVVQPVHEAAATCREAGVPLLVDAVQAAGKLPVDFGALGAALLVVSGHKVHGPKGVGALLVRSGARWKPPFPAAHEMGRRAGTEDVAAIAGFAAAARAVTEDLEQAAARMAEARDRFERVVIGALGDVTVNGTAERVPNTSNLGFRGLEADRLLALLDRNGVDASNGSACSAGSREQSHVLTAMGLSRRDIATSLRFSLSRLTTDGDADRAAAIVIESVETLRRRARR